MWTQLSGQTSTEERRALRIRSVRNTAGRSSGPKYLEARLALPSTHTLYDQVVLLVIMHLENLFHHMGPQDVHSSTAHKKPKLQTAQTPVDMRMG